MVAPSFPFSDRSGDIFPPSVTGVIIATADDDVCTNSTTSLLIGFALPDSAGDTVTSFTPSGLRTSESNEYFIGARQPAVSRTRAG